jgi:hypothetical protein
MTGAALSVDSGWTAHGPCSASMPHNFHCAEKQATRRPCALMQAPWQGKFELIEGVILHESMPEHAMAAE